MVAHPLPPKDWQQIILELRSGRGQKLRVIPKSEVGVIPQNFSKEIGMGNLAIFEESGFTNSRNKDNPVLILQFNEYYIAALENNHPVAEFTDINSGGILKAAIWAVILAGGYSALQKILQSESNSTGQDSTRLPRLAHAARKLENKHYKIFISHSWGYHDDYQTIERFLNECDALNWENHSVPSTDQLDVTDDEALDRELHNQMRGTSVVIVSAGMYVSHSKWIPREIEIAEKMEKSIIGIRKRGNQRVPSDVSSSADTIVGWQQPSLVEALAEYA